MIIGSIKTILLYALASYCAQIMSYRTASLKSAPDRIMAFFIMFASLVVFQLEFAGSGIGPLKISYASSLVMFGLLLATLLYGKKAPENSERPAPPSTFEKLGPAPALAVAAAFSVIFLYAAYALIAPPAPTDAFLDHLVFPAEWLRAGKIVMVQTLSPDQATTYYPSNSELLYLWNMLPIHDDLLAGLLEPACLLISAIAGCRIATRMGLKSGPAIAAAAISAAVPGVAVMALHSGVDLFFTAFILCCAAFLMPDENGERSIGEIALAGFAAGLAIGSKYVGVISVACLAPLLLAGMGGKKSIKIPSTILIFAACAAITGGFWYFRNYVFTGSAFYPLGLKIGDATIMPGAFYKQAMRNAYLHVSYGDIKAFANIFRIHLLGPIAPALFAAGFVAFRFGDSRRAAKAVFAMLCLSICAAILLIKKDIDLRMFGWIVPAALLALSGLLLIIADKECEWWKRYAAFLGPLLFIIFWFVNPYNTANNYRFTAPAVFFIAACVFPRADDNRSSWFFGAAALVAVFSNMATIKRCAAFLVMALRNPGEDAWLGAVGWTTFFAALFCAALSAALIFAFIGKKGYFRICICAACLALPIFLHVKSGQMEIGRYNWYGSHYLGRGWRAVGAIKQPLIIAYAGNCSPYGLYGNRLKNKVKYINLDGRRGKLFHDYENELKRMPGYIMPVDSVGLNYVLRSSQNYEKWLETLRYEQAAILFVSREFYRGVISDPVELTWALSNPKTFKQVYHSGDVFVFAIRNNAGN